MVGGEQEIGAPTTHPGGAFLPCLPAPASGRASFQHLPWAGHASKAVEPETKQLVLVARLTGTADFTHF